MSEQTISDNIAKLLERVSDAIQKRPESGAPVEVLAVSKTRPAAALREAYHCGLTQFGENYLDEALIKIDALEDLPLTWHFIGPLQSNKTRAIAGKFDWVHSVDRDKIARRLNDQRPHHLEPLQVCIQVNISGEASKSGVSPNELSALCTQISQLPRLKLRGLMAIPAATTDTAAQHRAFATLREILSELRTSWKDLDTLSMGMSQDMEAAIIEGATIVRVGTDIFGPRNA